MLEKIALQKHLITSEQCTQALKACKGAPNLEMALKDYFVSEGLISVPRMKQVIATFQAIKVMKKNAIFGTIAVKLGFVDKSVFQAEMARQKKAAGCQHTPQFIGEIWIKDKILSREQFIRILRIQEKRPGMSPSKGSARTRAAGPARETASGSTPGPGPEPGAGSGTASEKAPETTPVPPPAEDLSLTKQLDCGLVLEIDQQGMIAVLRKTDRFDPALSAAKLAEILEDEGIVFGRVVTEQLQGFIRSGGFKTKPFQVAAGNPPRPGKDARIEYHFDTDHLKAGEFDDEGNVDFRDRGEIPWVEEGALLAEKFSMESAHNGINVFDQEIEVLPVADIPLRYKSGVTLSDDECRLYAEISGHPRLSWSGNVQVSDVFLVKNDVNYETGHLDYHGDIDVRGTLKAGFRVKGDTIRINTVDGGEITAEGDVTVDNGVNDARIYARGNVTAKFIQNSTIHCLGNLTVLKEIVDTTVEASGAVFIPAGEVLSSDITANMGMIARHLGTDKSVPNTVTMGVDLFTAKELKTIQKAIRRTKARIEETQGKIKSFENDIQTLHQSTGRLAYELDMTRDEGRYLEEKIAEEKENSPQAKALKSQIHQNRTHFSRLDNDLNQYFDRIEKNEARILELEVEQDQLEDELDDRHYELANFTDWRETNPGRPEITVTGRITAATVVKGPRASHEIPGQLHNVTLRETQTPNQEEEGHQIQIHENAKR